MLAPVVVTSLISPKFNDAVTVILPSASEAVVIPPPPAICNVSPYPILLTVESSAAT